MQGICLSDQQVQEELEEEFFALLGEDDPSDGHSRKFRVFLCACLEMLASIPEARFKSKAHAMLNAAKRLHPNEMLTVSFACRDKDPEGD